MKKILIIMTSHQTLQNTDNKTGVWSGEFTDPYYEFIDNGYQVTLATPMGNQPPIDPMSELTEHITAANRRFQKDPAAKNALANTKRLDEVVEDEYDALFYPGGHGPMFDLANDLTSGSLIANYLNSGKPVAAVCHGPAALIKAAELDADILKGKNITGFSNAEEKLAFRSDNIPYHLEDKLKELGAKYHKNLIPFLSHVETDGFLITGQNPLSAGPTAKKLMEVLEGKRH